MRHGEDYLLPNGGNTAENVYTQMLLQICRDYTVLPDFKELKARHIRFFYDGLRPELKRAQESRS